MTALNDGVITPVLQSLFTLSDSIDAISCAADLVPDNFDDSGIAIGMMFKRLSECLQNDFASLSYEILNGKSKTS